MLQSTLCRMASEKKRCFFSDLEKTLLLELVDTKKDLLESKVTDRLSLKRKNKGWEDLTEDFNAQAGVTIRTTAQLKKFWSNLKVRAKKEIGREIRRTEGSFETQRTSLNACSSPQIDHPEEFGCSLTDLDSDEDLFTANGDDHQQALHKSALRGLHDIRARQVARSRQRLIASQRAFIKYEEAEHKLHLIKVREQVKFLREEHRKRMDILKLEEATQQLKYENEQSNRTLLATQNLLYESKLHNVVNPIDYKPV